MAVDLAKVAKDKKIEFFLISFVDYFGVLRAKLVPASAIGIMQRDGAVPPLSNHHTILDDHGTYWNLPLLLCPTCQIQRMRHPLLILLFYSHSIVAGGFPEMS